MFNGSIVALVTPFQNTQVNWDDLERLVNWHIDQGTAGIVPCGTTGESATLTHQEHIDVVRFCIDKASKRVPIIAGTGSNNTAEAIAYTQAAQKDGADAALVITPYYNKPTQDGLYQHFKAIHDASDIPIILYDVPGRCVTNIEDDTIQRLVELPRIQGIKDATADLARPVRLQSILKDNFSLLSGEDATTLPFLASGGHGCISVTANVAPALCTALYDAWGKGDIATAQKINTRLMPVHDALFCETSPGPVKYALELMGHTSSDMRLPMVSISAQSKQQVRAALESAALLS